jgi:hypothetical protein
MSAQINIFEIHVGFPPNLTGSLNLLPNGSEGRWLNLRAMEVVTALSDQDHFAAHDVPGDLSILVTRRFTDVRVAHGMIDEIAARFAHKPDIRIELEQVLLCEDDGRHRPIQACVDFNPSQQALRHAQLIPRIPPFEVHYAIKSKDQLIINHEIGVFIELAKQAGVRLDQAARFQSPRSEQKIILTSYFAGYKGMLDMAQEFADRLRIGLSALDSKLQLKATAERILLCAKPK